MCKASYVASCQSRIRTCCGQILVGFLCFGMASAGETWNTVTEKEGLPGDQVQVLAADGDGGVWIGTLSGLGHFSGGAFSVVLKDEKIWDVLPDGPGQCWVGSEKGAIRVGKDKAERFLDGKSVAPIVRRDKQTLWAITRAPEVEEVPAPDAGAKAKDNAAAAETDLSAPELMAFDGAQWAPLKGFAGVRVENILRASDGAMQVTVDGDGLRVVPPGADADKPARELQGINVKVMFEDSAKRLWCGTWGQGLFVREGGKFVRHLEKETSAILAITEDAKKRLWCGTSANGLWWYDGRRWQNELAAEGSVNLVASTSDGRVWISTQKVGGLRYRRAGGWSVAIPGPLPIRCLRETEASGLWAGGVLNGVHMRQ